MANITKTIGRSTARGEYIEATAELRDGSDGLSPVFSVTGSLWEKRSNAGGRARKRMGCEEDMGGCIHEEILRVFPKLAPLVKVHLASPDGLPMQAKVNGWYFYSGDASIWEREQIERGRDYGYSRMLKSTDRERAARALNILPSELPAGMDKEQFEAFVDSLADPYAADAAEARRVLDSLVDGDGVEAGR